MTEVGRVVMKIAGRDAGKVGVITEVVDNNSVIIDGQTRKRKVNIKHIEITTKKVEIGKGATSEEIAKQLSGLGFRVMQKGARSEGKEKPKSKRAQKSSEKKEKPKKQAKEKDPAKKKSGKTTKKQPEKKK
jgi:large subunit ribosomal protein L14e